MTKSIESMWATNESLLQSYRNIFISSQAFLLAVGAVSAQSGTITFPLIFIIAQIIIWFIWRPVVFYRGLIVDFYKFQNKGENIGYSEQEYLESRNIRENVNRKLGIKSKRRPTRFKLDFVLPILYSLVWIFLLFGSHIPIKF